MNENGFIIIFNFHLDTTETSLEHACKNRVIPRTTPQHPATSRTTLQQPFTTRTTLKQPFTTREPHFSNPSPQEPPPQEPRLRTPPPQEPRLSIPSPAELEIFFFKQFPDTSANPLQDSMQTLDHLFINPLYSPISPAYTPNRAGWAMSQPLPVSSYEWIAGEEISEDY
ncbi:hypothetical protein JTE90_005323 [Oedothorax gibbosus]|uniref:Uncharacterized protein n=1 Tax=Oedothorax gibbosus TaxID=931172 RepID=A0AAV6UHZ4_9ARAC|nr:hypothetical protein JTE90_005323 [Oedothorax gibbosus]